MRRNGYGHTSIKQSCNEVAGAKVSSHVIYFEENPAKMTWLGGVPHIGILDDPVWLGATLALLLCLLLITLEDLRSFRIPDTLSLPLITAGLILAWLLPDFDRRSTGLPDHLIGAAVAFLLFALTGEVIFRRTGTEALGLGDAKLFGAAGAWLGWQALPSVLLIASFGGLGCALIVRHRTGRSAIAFGPWIALGFLSVWLSAAVG